MFTSIIVAALISFIATFFLTKFFIKYFSDSGMVATDMHKPSKPKIPTSGGVAVMLGFLIGFLSYIFAATYLLSGHLNLEVLFGAATSILIAGIIGLIDDIHIKAKKEVTTGIKDTKVGLKQYQKFLLTLLIPIPFMVIQLPSQSIWLPFFGVVHLGVLYTFVLVPLAIVFMANAVNLLAGFNGLESGTSLVASLGVGVFALFFGNPEGALISLLLSGSLLAFLLFNKYPAKVLPGDSLTYTAGAALATAVIAGNIEKFGVVVFVPWLIEFLLKLRSGMKASSLGVLQKDGTLKPPYGKKIYSLTHVVMNMKGMTEAKGAFLLILFEALFVFLAFVLFYLGFYRL